MAINDNMIKVYNSSNTAIPWGGNSIAPLTGTTSGTSTFPPPDPCLAGHTVGEDQVEYVDGVIVAYCVVCGDRIEMSRVPGGLPFARVKALLGELAALDVTEEGLAAILGSFVEIRTQIEQEEFALKQARKLFEIAENLLNTQLEKDELDSEVSGA